MKICPACQTAYGNEVRFCPRDEALLIGGILEPGTVLRKKYRILSRIGLGGMAVVYRARHLLWNEDRAIKILRQPGNEAFLAEAQIMRLLQHPHIVRVDDADFTEDDQPFVVMEYIEGEDLRCRMRRAGRMAPEEALRIIAEACSGLTAAHERGVVHRDIKPQNLLLARGANGRETVKVIDFGIAKVREAVGLGFTGAAASMTGDFVGTPDYASPEQALGIRSSELDGRTDLYSLGLVLYEMLTGALPFRGDTPIGVLVQRLQVVPAPPQSVRPDLPPGVCEIVVRSLQRERADRFSSAAEMEAACEQELAALARAREDAARRAEDARAAQRAAAERREKLERRRSQRWKVLSDSGKRIAALVPGAPGKTGAVAAGIAGVIAILGIAALNNSYVKYSDLVDSALAARPAGGSIIYGAPRLIAVGDSMQLQDLIGRLWAAGYTESKSNPLGYFQARATSVDIYPGAKSYFDAQPGVVRFEGGRVAQILSLQDNTNRQQYQLEPVPMRFSESQRKQPEPRPVRRLATRPG